MTLPWIQLSAPRRRYGMGNVRAYSPIILKLRDADSPRVLRVAPWTVMARVSIAAICFAFYDALLNIGDEVRAGTTQSCVKRA